MLIISPIKNEGVINLDQVCHICVKELKSGDGEVIWSLFLAGAPALPKFIGEWDSKEKADKALEEIIKGHHCGNKEVYLD